MTERRPGLQLARSILVLGVAISAGIVGCGRDDLDTNPSTPAAVRLEPRRAMGSLAHARDAEVNGEDFAQFLDVARGSGYRPATLEEAKRLVRVALVERIIDRERIARGLGDGAEFHEEARVALLKELGGNSPADQDADAATRASREALQRSAFNDLLLDREIVELDEAALSTWVDPTLATNAGSPPVPPGMPLLDGRSQ